MEGCFVTLTPENLDSQHLCCIIRSKVKHPGVEAKRTWLKQRLKEGHVFRKLDKKATVFIEYAPLEKAWVPVEGDNYLYLYCLWVTGAERGHGYARALMESCIADAKAQGKSGVCMLGAQKQKNWLSNQDFARKFGFETVDTTDSGYELLALSFDGTKPRFTDSVRRGRIDDPALTIYYDHQCPFILQHIEGVQAFRRENDVELKLILVDTLEKAKALPCPFNNWAVFYEGEFQTVNLGLPGPLMKRLQKK